MEKNYGKKLDFKYEVNTEGKKSLYTLTLILKKDGTFFRILKKEDTFLLNACRIFSRTNWIAIKCYNTFKT